MGKKLKATETTKGWRRKEQTHRIGVKKGDCYLCTEIKGANTKMSLKGVFSRSENSLDIYFKEEERGRCITADVTFAVSFILKVAFPKWFRILCHCALYY